jgi:hypothetical protein
MGPVREPSVSCRSRIIPDFPMVNGESAAFLQQVHRLRQRNVHKTWNSHIVFVSNVRG